MSVRWDYATGNDGPTTVSVEWHVGEDGKEGWYMDAVGPDNDWHVCIVEQRLGTTADVGSAMAEAARVVEQALLA